MADQNKGGVRLLATVAVFGLVGPLIGTMVFLVGLGLTLGAVRSAVDLMNMSIGALAISLVLATLGIIPAVITGVISGLVSRGTLSARRWITYSGALGGGVSAVSLLTVLVVYVFARDHSFWSALLWGIGTMFVTGAVSGAVCAALCLKFRPRKALPKAAP